MLVIGSALALAFMASIASDSAHASFFTFCSPSSLNSPNQPGDRCVHSVARVYQYVRVSSAVTTTQCAIVKTSATGGGSNATAPNCQYTLGPIYSYCSVPYSCNGWPTITNGGVATGYQYFGAANF
jgi:hypothetical protein